MRAHRPERADRGISGRRRGCLRGWSTRFGPVAVAEGRV